MDHYFIKRWQAKELFIRMLSEYYKNRFAKNAAIELGNLRDKRTLEKRLKHFGKFPHSKEFADSELKKFGAGQKGRWHYPSILRDFSKTIRKGVPLVLSDIRLQIIFKYIGEDIGELEKYYDKIQENATELEKILEDTTWFTYYGEPYTDSDSSEEKLCIIRVVTKLYQYGSMVSYDISTNNAEPIKEVLYKGQYYTRGDRYLFVEGRVDNQRELRKIFDVKLSSKLRASGETMMGYFSNASFDIYFGPTVFEKVSNDIALDYKIFKYKEHSIDGEKIPDDIWDALAGTYKFYLPEVLNIIDSDRK